VRKADEGGGDVKAKGKSICAVFCFACGAFGAVDGTVMNRTTGKLQGGATVTLYKLGQAGMESIESVKSDGLGKFRIERDVQGPHLVQTAFDGVTYNHMLPPGAPTSGITLEVFNASKQPGAARVDQHIVLFEPSGNQMLVSETYLFKNNGKTTYNDPDGGTLRFYLPDTAKGVVQVNATAPQGMPIRRAAEKTAKSNVYKVDFPIKPGDTRIDLTYMAPFTPGSSFEGRVLYKSGGPTRLVVPSGVSLKGEGIESLGQEPRTQASIYGVKGLEYKVEIQGAGALRETESSEAGPGIVQIMPKVYQGIDGSAGLLAKVSAVKWILALAFGALSLGFVLLYRAQAPRELAAAPKGPVSAKGRDERRRR
jgi:hypothetical protein